MLLADRRKADCRLLFRTTNQKSRKRIFERGIIITDDDSVFFQGWRRQQLERTPDSRSARTGLKKLPQAAACKKDGISSGPESDERLLQPALCGLQQTAQSESRKNPDMESYRGASEHQNGKTEI